MTYINGTVKGPASESEVRFLIDSGAMYSLLPEPVWKAIGLTPEKDPVPFSLADGTRIYRSMSECQITLPPHPTRHTPVVLGDPEDPVALLGVITLEEMGLMFDPFHRTLHPMRMLLMRAG